MQRLAGTYITAFAAILGGLFVCIALWAARTGGEQFPLFLTGPGLFFLRSYAHLSLYVPIYLWTVAFMLLRRHLHRPLLFVMTGAVLPLLTFALIFQLLTGTFGPAAQVFADTFGVRMGATLLLLLGMAEIAALYFITMHFYYGMKIFSPPRPKLLQAPAASGDDGTGDESSEFKRIGKDQSVKEPYTELQSRRTVDSDGKTPEESPEEAWNSFETPDRGISFPEIPELPPLKVSSSMDPRKHPEEPDRSGEPSGPAEEFEILEEPGTREELEPLEELETAEEPEGFEEQEEIEELLPPREPLSDEGLPEETVAEVLTDEGMEETASGKDGKDEAKAKKPEARPRGFTYANYSVPEDELLQEYPDHHYWVIDDETRKWAEVLKNTLEEFKISAEVTGIQKGPVITMFEILPAPGVKLSKIVNLADNIALRLAARRVRIVAPIPGKHAVGIEVPNKKRSLVSFKEMLQSEVFRDADMEIPIILGKDITGETQILNLSQTPHLLIAGATGSGKSVCVNSIICSILYTRSPAEVRMVLVDPKIVELKMYNDIPHLLTPVITEPKRAFQVLQYLLYEMERRYSLLDSLGVRDIQSYNKKIKRKRLATEPLPYIVVIVDEFADLMATSGKELESTLARLAAMSRAIGIHLVLATQRPSIDVITGLIKANIPSRIAFMVAGKFDSRIIIDTVGAEKLLGQGDMLLTTAWNPHPVRIQGAYLSEDEVEQVTDYIRTLGDPDYIDEEIFFDDDEDDWNLEMGSSGDPLMGKAIDVVVSAGKASASYLQRRLKIGYNRAARIVEEMEERGIVGPQNGSKPREILHIPDDHE